MFVDYSVLLSEVLSVQNNTMVYGAQQARGMQLLSEVLSEWARGHTMKKNNQPKPSLQLTIARIYPDHLC